MTREAKTTMPGDRCHIDDGTAALCFHLRDRKFHAVKDTFDIGGHMILELFHGDVFDQRRGHEDARIVEQHVQTTSVRNDG